jgi:hypothetical protein
MVSRWLARQAARPWSAQLMPALLAVVCCVFGAVVLREDAATAAILFVLGGVNAAVLGAVAAVKRRSSGA